MMVRATVRGHPLPLAKFRSVGPWFESTSPHDFVIFVFNNSLKFNTSSVERACVTHIRSFLNRPLYFYIKIARVTASALRAGLGRGGSLQV